MSTGAHRNGTLGTFAGVFTPSILTILGIILFLRIGYVVGQTGLLRALVIILAANLISLLTTASLSAIATNIRVKGGGDYYLISRTLGVEFGGAIGIVLFLAQAVSIAFYCFGFGEALVALLPPLAWLSARAVAIALLVPIFVFAWLGADWASRLQFAIMGVLAAALVSFFMGGFGAWDTATLRANWQPPASGMPFWAAFALFFPAVTGFTQGVSMSGDLRDPGRSLPTGTFAAVGLSMVVYLITAIVLAASLPSEALALDYQSMNRVAVIGGLISAGVMAATASSAMASHLGAPRILQALAADAVFPFLGVFAKGSGADNNPRRAVLLASAIAVGVIALGNLNAIAPVVAMFFLISYGLLNYATYYEVRASSPHFRPQFRFFHEHLSLAGAVGCLIAMLAIHATAALISVALLFAIHQYVKRTVGRMQWADSRHAYNFQRIRDLAFAMQREQPHPRDWRPQIIVLSKDEKRRRQVLFFGSWIEGDSGITTLVSIVESEDPHADARKEQLRVELERNIEEWQIKAFALVVKADSFRSGMEVLLQTYGLGPIKPNIVLLNWLEEAPDAQRERAERIFGRNLREAIRLGCNIVALSARDDAFDRILSNPPKERRIDIWWAGDASSRLSLILAYLMTRTEPWRDATITVHAQAHHKHPELTMDRLQETLEEVRIDAEVSVVEGPLDSGVVFRRSTDASLVFLPVRLRGHVLTDFLGGPLSAIDDHDLAIALVLAGKDIDLDVEPDVPAEPGDLP